MGSSLSSYQQLVIVLNILITYYSSSLFTEDNLKNDTKYTNL